MPIANSYLTAFHLARVKYPDQMITATGNYTSTAITGGVDIITPPSLLETDVAYTRYEVKSEENAAPVELIQAWPEAKFFDVGVVTHLHEIDLPLILVPSSTGANTYRIRLNELKFWLSWMIYMFSTFDRASWTNPDPGGTGGDFSAVVERAGIVATTDGLKFSLSIRTNVPMGWNLVLANPNAGSRPKVIGRPATNYDTFVKYEDYTIGDKPTDYKGVGLNDFWGVNQMSLEARTVAEHLAHTPYTVTAGTTSTDVSGWLITDQINAKIVNFQGSLNGFGPVSGKSLGPMNLSTQMGYSQVGGGYSLGTILATDQDDPFPYTKSATGGIQIYVGSALTDMGITGQAMFLLPTGTLISSGGILASGNGTVGVTRQWQGTITNTPTSGSAFLRARTGV